MPLYDYECPKCEHAFVDVWLTVSQFSDHMPFECPNHGKQMFHVKLGASNLDDWGNEGVDGRYFEHLSPKGLYFRDRKSFKDYLRRHGLREQNSYVD